MDDIEYRVNSRINYFGSIEGAILQAQIAAMNVEIAKLANKAYALPPPLLSDSLMTLFSIQPVT